MRRKKQRLEVVKTIRLPEELNQYIESSALAGYREYGQQVRMMLYIARDSIQSEGSKDQVDRDALHNPELMEQLR